MEATPHKAEGTTPSEEESFPGFLARACVDSVDEGTVMNVANATGKVLGYKILDGTRVVSA